MKTGLDDVDTDVPMQVIDLQRTVGGWRVLTDGSGLDTELSTCVLRPISEEVKNYEVQEEDFGNEMNLVPERQVYDSKTGIDISREKAREGRKAAMKEMMDHHVFDEVPDSEAAGKKFIRAKWLHGDTVEKARERLVAKEIAAFQVKRDDKHAITPAPKVARMLVSRAARDLRLDDASWVKTTSESQSSSRWWRTSCAFA